MFVDFFGGVSFMLCCVNWVSWMLRMVLSGAQFKAFVEYAPSQQVPKSNIKKDGREGTIMKGLRQSLYLILCPIVSFYHITIFLNLDFVVLELLDPEYLSFLSLFQSLLSICLVLKFSLKGKKLKGQVEYAVITFYS